jgi:hypothetical protein
MRIYHNGEQVRDSEGKFTSFRKMIWRACEYVLSALFIILFVGLYLGSKTEPLTYVAQASVIDSFPAKIEKLKDEVVNDLSKCESGGHSGDDGIIIFDSNAKASIGVMQFQKNTVKHYVKVLYGKDITGQEAVELAINPVEAKKLAKAIIFETTNGSHKDWVNCTNKLGLKAKVEIIKQLEK